MEERGEGFNFEEAKKLTEKFEKAISAGVTGYFESDQLELIIDYCIEENKLATAAIAADRGLSQYPYSEFFLLRKAQLLAAESKYHPALEILAKIEAIDPTNADVLITKGTIYSQMGMNKNALQCFNQAVQVSENPDEVYMFIAFEYENLGSYEMALKNLKKAAEINLENDAVLFEIGFCFETLEKTTEAIEYFESVVDKHPYSMSGWYSLGLFLNKNLEYDKALEAYDFAIAIDDEFPSAHFNRGNTLANLFKFREAISSYHEALKLEDPDPITYFYIGECHEQLGEADKALSNYEKAIKLDERYADPWYGIAMILENQGRFHEAYHYIKKATELSSNSDYYYLQGDIEKALGYHEEAIESYRYVSNHDPELIDIWIDLSDLLFKQEERLEALEVITEGIKNHPDEAEFYYKMVAFLLELGMKQNAIEVFQTALELNYEKHESLFEFYPPAQMMSEIQDLIEMHKK
ncbi:MAG: tetratricopeptide repeat protein [Bacteroidia bacterium]|nr:tetratricopeptide repeat protein [Bacteroidia bacterium]